jgi:hypothetical protein
VTLTGSNLGEVPSVYVGGRVVESTLSEDNATITFNFPSMNEGNHTINVCADNMGCTRHYVGQVTFNVTSVSTTTVARGGSII